MNKTRITVDLPNSLVKEIEKHLEGFSKYPNRSEFIRDAIREKISIDNLPPVGQHRFLEIKPRVFYGKDKNLSKGDMKMEEANWEWIKEIANTSRSEYCADLEMDIEQELCKAVIEIKKNLGKG